MRSLIFLLMLSCGSGDSMPKCGPENCSGCCRKDGICEDDGTDDRTCGARGSLCADCVDLNGFCNAGACTQCNPGTCAGGCCNGGHCFQGNDIANCGKNGQTCESCPFTPNLNIATCTNGICGTSP